MNVKIIMFTIVIIVFSSAGRSSRMNSITTSNSSSIEFLAAAAAAPARIRSGLTESFPSLSYFTALGGAAAVFVVGSRAFIAALESLANANQNTSFCVIECTTFLCSKPGYKSSFNGILMILILLHTCTGIQEYTMRLPFVVFVGESQHQVSVASGLATCAGALFQDAHGTWCCFT